MRRPVTDTSLLHHINITPLLDVFLVLLVALIAMVPLAVQDIVAQAEAQVRSIPEKVNGPLHVLLVEPTTLRLDGQPVTLASLATLTGTIRIMSGTQTSYGRVLSVAQHVANLPGVSMRFAVTDSLPVDVAPAPPRLPPPLLPGMVSQ